MATALELVNPARAGMIPVSLAQLERLEGKPRASGDDPYGTGEYFQTT